MSDSSNKLDVQTQHRNDRLVDVFFEATELDVDGLKILCPSYSALSEVSQRYKKLTLLGKGGVKEVYRAYDNKTQRWVALARLRQDRKEEFYDLLVNEAWLTASLNHPNIINVHDVGIDKKGQPFFTMDLKGDSTLANIIKAQDQDLRDLLKIFLKVCEAVSYAHSRHTLHLDLKPENIQTNSFGEVLVCDWGLARRIATADVSMITNGSLDQRDQITLLGEVKGTPGYMAPEQTEKGHNLDPRTDIFSLGCILHTLLTGEPPFSGGRDTIIAASQEAIPSLYTNSQLSDSIPSGVVAICDKALAHHPDDRYQAVTHLKNDIQRHLDGFSSKAETASIFREAKLFVSRNRLPVTLSAIALIGLTFLSTIFIQHINSLKKTVKKETQLTHQYASDAKFANEQHLETITQSTKENQLLSNSLLASVSNLKNRGIYYNPLNSIQEAKAISSHALKLNPHSKRAKYQLFSLNFIQLNFAEALKYPVPPHSIRYPYMKIALAYPTFEYSRQNRPNIKKLAQFITSITNLEPNQSHIIERIIAYDTATRRPLRGYRPVVIAFLKYLNPESKFTLTNNKNRELTLCSDSSLHLIGNKESSKLCVLRFLGPKALKLKNSRQFDLNQLKGLDIEALDISNCDIAPLQNLIFLPKLKSITIDPSKVEETAIRSKVISASNYSIIKAP